mgnify:CR=1 FL=1
MCSGTMCSYYIGVESSEIPIPGMAQNLQGLCLVPQGSEEGNSLPSPTNTFGLVTGEKANFRFFASKSRPKDKVDDIISDAESNLTEAASIELNMPCIEDKKNQIVPVSMQAKVSDVGILELSMKHLYSDKKWDLEFNVRSD